MEGGRTTSLWGATTEFLTTQPLDRDIETDILVVGAGIGGMTAAYLLAEAGKRVVVVDDGPVAGGETCRTTAHLSNAIDDRYYNLERLFGASSSRLAAESQSQAINKIEQLVESLKIDCEFERLDGFLFVDPGGSDEELRRELDACLRAGMSNVDSVDRVGVPNFKSGKALRFRNQGQFHPLKYVNGLTRAFEKLGGRVYTGTHVISSSAPKPEPTEGRADEHVNGDSVKKSNVEIRTSDGHCIFAKHAVFATNTPVNDWVVIHSKQAAYRTYAIGYEVPKGTFEHALLWDTLDPYHYIRIHPLVDRDIVIVGGEDHKTAQSDPSTGDASPERWSALDTFAKQHMDLPAEPRYKWSGQVMEPVDGLPFLGRNPMDDTNTYIITGDSGMGMTNATVGAIIVSDLILDRQNPWVELYDPGRITLRAAGEWLKENLNVAAEYTRWLGKGEVKSVNEIPRGVGAIVTVGASKVAAYRDENGELHELSARCTHLSCVVHWNTVEKTWDCPCHGSRFTAMGEVLNGPAVAPLEPATRHA